MKKILIIPAICCALIMTFSFGSQKEEDKASIYIYRLGQFNSAANNWAIFADNVKICKLSNNKFLKMEVAPGKHVFTAKIGGVEIFKKETGVEIEAEAGKSYYIACDVKQSITRSRLELLEVTKSTADKQMARLTMDNCQQKIDGGDSPAK